MSRLYKTSFSLDEDTRDLITRIQGKLQVKESKNITKSDVVARALSQYDNSLKLERKSKNG